MTMEWEEITWHVKALKKQLENEPDSLNYVFEACKKAISNNDWPFSIAKLRDETLPKLLREEYNDENGAWGAAYSALYYYILSNSEFQAITEDLIDLKHIRKLDALQAIYGEDFVKYEYFSHDTRAPYAIKKQPYSNNGDVLRITRVDGEFLDLNVSIHDYFNLINGLLDNIPIYSLSNNFGDQYPEELLDKIKKDLYKLQNIKWIRDDEDDNS
jgi:hypothetical protein